MGNGAGLQEFSARDFALEEAKAAIEGAGMVWDASFEEAFELYKDSGGRIDAEDLVSIATFDYRFEETWKDLFPEPFLHVYFLGIAMLRSWKDLGDNERVGIPLVSVSKKLARVLIFANLTPLCKTDHSILRQDVYDGSYEDWVDDGGGHLHVKTIGVMVSLLRDESWKKTELGKRLKAGKDDVIGWAKTDAESRSIKDLLKELKTIKQRKEEEEGGESEVGEEEKAGPGPAGGFAMFNAAKDLVSSGLGGAKDKAFSAVDAIVSDMGNDDHLVALVLGKRDKDGTLRLVLYRLPDVMLVTISPRCDSSGFFHAAWGTNPMLYEKIGVNTATIQQKIEVNGSSGLGRICCRGSVPLLLSARFSKMAVDYSAVTSKARFSLLLHTLKWRALERLKKQIVIGKAKIPRVVHEELTPLRYEMEHIYNNSIEWLSVKLMRNRKKLGQILPPHNELLGSVSLLLIFIFSDRS